MLSEVDRVMFKKIQQISNMMIIYLDQEKITQLDTKIVIKTLNTMYINFQIDLFKAKPYLML